MFIKLLKIDWDWKQNHKSQGSEVVDLNNWIIYNFFYSWQVTWRNCWQQQTGSLTCGSPGSPLSKGDGHTRLLVLCYGSRSHYGSMSYYAVWEHNVNYRGQSDLISVMMLWSLMLWMKRLLNFSVSFVSYFIQCNKLIIFMCDTICGLKFNGMFMQVLEEHNQYE